MICLDICRLVDIYALTQIAGLYGQHMFICVVHSELYLCSQLALTVSMLAGATVVVIVWKLDLQLPAQSVPITTKIVSSNHVQGEVYSMQHYVIKFVSDMRQVGGFLRYSGFLF